MIDTSHHHVPVGTIANHEGTPVTIRRDYACIEIGGVKIPLDQFPALRAILDDAEPDMIACEAEMAAEAEEAAADDDQPEAVLTPTEMHGLALHGTETTED